MTKGKLNPADGSSRRLNYIDAATNEAPDTIIAKLIPSLENKLTYKLYACKAGEYESTPE